MFVQLWLLGVAWAHVATLMVTVHYPSGHRVLSSECNGKLAGYVDRIGSSSVNFTVFQYSGDDTYTASFEYPVDEVGKEVEVTIAILNNMFFTGTAMEDVTCQDVCPTFSAVTRNLGRKNYVHLREGGTDLDIWPFFCYTAGRVTSARLWSKELQEARDFIVYEPPSLLENPLPRAEPVNLGILQIVQDNWLHIPLFTSGLDTLNTNGYIGELLLVSLDASKNSHDVLTHIECTDKCTCPDYVKASRWCSNVSKTCGKADSHNGRAKDYTDFLKSTLLPHLEDTYSARFRPSHTVSWGVGLGGLFAYWSGVHAPDVFGLVFASSPSLWYACGDVLQYTPAVGHAKVYFDVGTAESEDTTLPPLLKLREMEAVGFKEGTDVFLTYRKGDSYDTNSMLHQSTLGLLSLFGTRDAVEAGWKYVPLLDQPASKYLPDVQHFEFQLQQGERRDSSVALRVALGPVAQDSPGESSEPLERDSLVAEEFEKTGTKLEETDSGALLAALSKMDELVQSWQQQSNTVKRLLKMRHQPQRSATMNHRRPHNLH